MNSIESYINGSACSGSSSNLVKTLVSEDDPIAKSNLLGLGGFETEKELALLDSSLMRRVTCIRKKKAG